MILTLRNIFSVFGKTVENVRKQRTIKLVPAERRRNYLVSKPNYHATILMNKHVYLGLSILGLSKTIMYEFWNDYIKQKHGENAKLCYMNTSNFEL